MTSSGSPSSLDLESRIGISFTDSGLLREALTHASSSAGRFMDNQRLEFLGDAVLQLILTEELFQRFPGHKEGAMTQWRSRMVSRPALAGYARAIELGRHLVMGENEEKQGGRDRDSTLADAFEALLAAIYLDKGWQTARDFILRTCRPDIEALKKDPSQAGNAKSRLQELLQEAAPIAPEYELLSEEGPAHCKTFRVQVLWQKQVLAEGSGPTKKAAQMQAALEALRSPVVMALTKKGG